MTWPGDIATSSKPNNCECIWHHDECVGCVGVGVGELHEYTAKES